MEGLVDELVEGAKEEMKIVAEQGGAVEAVAYMKARLVESHRERIAKIEQGEIKVIGQNSFTETEDSPLTAGADGGILTPDPEVERECREALERWKDERDAAAVERALSELAAAAGDDSVNIMPATIAAAKAGVTTGEWAQTLRDVFGDYRAPTGVSGSAAGGDEELLAADPRACQRARRADRPPAAHPGRQARSRRPLQRRRADRRARSRRRDGGHLPGHPADAGADRSIRARRGRGRGRPVDPLRVAPRADPRDRATAAGARRRCAGRRRRDHPRRRRREAARSRGRRRLHAEGLRRQPDHGRDRRARRRARAASTPSPA